MGMGLRGLGALLLLGVVTASAQHPDVSRYQSTELPRPKFITEFVDQGENDPRLKGYVTPRGMRLEIVADYPAVVNPVGMTFDDAGNAYVLEWLPGGGDWNEQQIPFTYKDGSVRNVAVMKKTVPDVVKVLTDTKGKGVYDAASVILEDELPSSILVHEGWIYLSGRGSVRRFRQSKPGGKYDVKEVIAKGFCGFHHHQVSGLTLSNDGRLYMTSGDDDNVVEGSDGSRATVWRTGAVFRSELDGSKMETFAVGFRNPYRDVAFDSQHNIFHADNDNEDGSKFTGCRLMHVAEGADYGWRLSPGARCCSADNLRGAAFGEMPGKMQPMLKTGRGAPAGLLIYNDSQFPDQYRDLLMYPDVFRKVIRAYAVQPEGATFKTTHEFELLKSDDPLFRPNQMVTGPDGAIYIVDWRTDSGGAGRLSGDGTHGRIYRLSWSGTPLYPARALRPLNTWAKLRGDTDGQLYLHLSGSDATVRDRALRELLRRGRFIDLQIMLANPKLPLAARTAALGGVQRQWNDSVEKGMLALLTDPEPTLRRMAVEALASRSAKGKVRVHGALVAKFKDVNPAVVRAAYLAVGKIAAPNAAADLAKAFSELPAEADRYLVDGLLRSLESLGAAGLTELVKGAVTPSATRRILDVARGLRTREGGIAVEKLLLLPNLATDDRVELLRVLPRIQGEPPLDTVVVMAPLFARAPDQPKGVKITALEVLSVSPVISAAAAVEFVTPFVNDKEEAVQLAAIRAAEAARLVKVSPEFLKCMPQETRVAVKAALLRALRNLGEKGLLPYLPPLTEHAAEAVRLEALRTLALWDVKAAQPVAKRFLSESSLELQGEAVSVLARNPEGARYLGEQYLAKKLPSLWMGQVVEGLSVHKDKDAAAFELWKQVTQAGLVLTLKPDEVAKWKGLVQSEGDAQRGRAVFLDGKLTACASCHRIEGVGGNVGPDLTRVWDTQSFEKLMESIVEPSKEIKEGYQTYAVTTTAGQTIQGLRISETAKEVVLRESNGKTTRLDKADIDDMRASAKSLMPEGSVTKLSPAQFSDLMAFLRSRAAQESLRGIVFDFVVAGPFSDKPTEEFVDVKNPNLEKWKPVRVGASTSLDFRALYNQDNISAYAATRVFSPKDQDALLLLGSDDGIRVWVNGTQVHEKLVARGATPGSDRVTVKLQKGWNTVLSRVFNGTLSHEMYLSVVKGEGMILNSDPGSAH